MLYVLVAFVAYVAGAFSHKWAASEAKQYTGVDPQAVADKLKKG